MGAPDFDLIAQWNILNAVINHRRRPARVQSVATGPLTRDQDLARFRFFRFGKMRFMFRSGACTGDCYGSCCHCPKPENMMIIKRDKGMRSLCCWATDFTISSLCNRWSSSICASPSLFFSFSWSNWSFCFSLNPKYILWRITGVRIIDTRTVSSKVSFSCNAAFCSSFFGNIKHKQTLESSQQGISTQTARKTPHWILFTKGHANTFNKYPKPKDETRPHSGHNDSHSQALPSKYLHSFDFLCFWIPNCTKIWGWKTQGKEYKKRWKKTLAGSVPELLQAVEVTVMRGRHLGNRSLDYHFFSLESSPDLPTEDGAT